MTGLPLGVDAYKRAYAGEPEIRLINRYAESDPSNLDEKLALISRPGSTFLAAGNTGIVRSTFSKVGLFGGDVFAVIGTQLFRISQTTTTLISGTIANVNNGYVYATWQKGIGYERLFISDGATLQFYTTHATGVLTLSGGSITDVDSGGQIIDIGGTYYAWSANIAAASQAGTLANPYRAKLGSATADSLGLTGDESSLSSMALLLNFSGVLGVDYATAVLGPSATVTAAGPTTNLSPLALTVTAIADLSTGNAIVTTVPTGSFLAWGAGTLTGGGSNALQQVLGMAAGENPASIENLASNILVAVGKSQKFYWVEPGATIIDPLNFAEKESNPDNISQMVTVGDQTVIMGDGSTENWYATGNFSAPFAPVEGRVYRRGTLPGTAVAVGDSVILVGDDGKVYSIGYSYGADSVFGVHRISTHSIEERIRTIIRSLNGYPA